MMRVRCTHKWCGVHAPQDYCSHSNCSRDAAGWPCRSCLHGIVARRRTPPCAAPAGHQAQQRVLDAVKSVCTLRVCSFAQASQLVASAFRKLSSRPSTRNPVSRIRMQHLACPLRSSSHAGQIGAVVEFALILCCRDIRHGRVSGLCLRQTKLSQPPCTGSGGRGVACRTAATAISANPAAADPSEQCLCRQVIAEEASH